MAVMELTVDETAIQLGNAVSALERVTDLLCAWAKDHSDECTAEVDAAIFCARRVIETAKR